MHSKAKKLVFWLGSDSVDSKKWKWEFISEKPSVLDDGAFPSGSIKKFLPWLLIQRMAKFVEVLWNYLKSLQYWMTVVFHLTQKK